MIPIRFIKSLHEYNKNKHYNNSLYMVFEGCEGSGKGYYLDKISSMLMKNKNNDKLLEYVKSINPNVKNIDVIITKEPNKFDSNIWDDINKITLNEELSNTKKMKLITKYFSDDRSKLMNELSISTNKEFHSDTFYFILSDRSIISSMIYQSNVDLKENINEIKLNKHGIKYILSKNFNGINNFKFPEKVFFINPNIETANSRIKVENPYDLNIKGNKNELIHKLYEQFFLTTFNLKEDFLCGLLKSKDVFEIKNDREIDINDVIEFLT